MREAALTPADLELMDKSFAANPAYRTMQNAVAQTSIDDIALDRHVVTSTDPTVSHLLDDWKATSQKQSGRCWLFAGLNLLRAGAMDKMNVADFEFSQNHVMYWDKLERANYFLEAVIDTSDRDADDRTVAFLLQEVAGDGGQWNMFTALVRKHGLVPKSVMPETESSSATRRMNAILRNVLRQGARDVRALRGSGVDAQRDEKARVLDVVHRVLRIHLGTPPTRFLWQWKDKDREFHRAGEMTPQEFAAEYVTIPYEDYVCLVNDPRESSPYGRTFTVDYLGNVVGGEPVTYLNVESDLMKKLAMDTVVGGEPVWFGCDVGQMMRRDLGIWDAKLFDYQSVYDTRFDLGKADRLVFHESLMTHAMLFTGVDVVDGAPRKWRVENSWGDETADKGFYTMNDSWFDEYVFEIAARKSALPAELRAALDTEPIVLPAWDPMGSLAR
ncbi:MAG: C1 family peptidase [Streptosporangiales bacterium]|nr:C1 family peptidase [Streptosporangiales bacterium]